MANESVCDLAGKGKVMATIQDVKEAEQNLQGTLKTVANTGPCAETASCSGTARDVAVQIETAAGLFLAGVPDASACAQAVAALDALATAFEQAPPVDSASAVAIEAAVGNTLSALA